MSSVLRLWRLRLRRLLLWLLRRVLLRLFLQPSFNTWWDSTHGGGSADRSHQRSDKGKAWGRRRGGTVDAAEAVEGGREAAGAGGRASHCFGGLWSQRHFEKEREIGSIGTQRNQR